MYHKRVADLFMRINDRCRARELSDGAAPLGEIGAHASRDVISLLV